MRKTLATYLVESGQSLSSIADLTPLTRQALQHRIDAGDIYVIVNRGKLHRVFVEKPIQVLYQRR